jgi:hypothetical protein
MGKIYTCLFCKLKFDTDEVEWDRYGTRYAHKSCIEKHNEKERLKEEKKKNKTDAPKTTTKRKKNIRKCYYCGGDVDITTDKYSKVHSNRYAHRECHIKNYTPDEEYIPKIYEYLKSINFNYNYTQCDKQRVNFIKTMGYSNEEIYLTLKYMYSIKKLSPERSEGRIGLVPYLKEEAIQYFHNIEKRQEEIGIAVEKQLERGVKVIRVLAPEKPVDKGYIDLGSIGDD